LGELSAAKAIDDEVAPAFGDALEPEKWLSGEAGEDLHDGVIREAISCSGLGPLGAIHGTTEAVPGGELRLQGERYEHRERNEAWQNCLGSLPATGDNGDQQIINTRALLVCGVQQP